MEVVSSVMTKAVNPLDLARLRRDKVISLGGTYQYNWYHR